MKKQNNKKMEQKIKSYEEYEHEFENKAGSVYFEHTKDTPC